MSTLSTANIQTKAANTPPVIKDLNGTEVGQFARAWVNFNGTGTVAIRDSFNVASITDNGTGDYRLNFSNSLANANFTCVATCGYDDGTYFEPRNISFFAHATNGVDVHTGYTTFNYQDQHRIECVVFGG